MTEAVGKEARGLRRRWKRRCPTLYHQLAASSDKLEDHYRDVQDIEFTIEEGKLFMLQTRNGKRTAKAAVKIAFDMVKES